jgi:hypothetical protein|tara:strand:- start:91 stop:219 length:129 start_codon:yes stop_codon:yes gene_type:complete
MAFFDSFSDLEWDPGTPLAVADVLIRQKSVSRTYEFHRNLTT